MTVSTNRELGAVDEDTTEDLPGDIESYREHLAEPKPAARRADAAPPSIGTALPRHIVGGFAKIADDLDQRSRDSGLMVRLLEQLRLQLDVSEQETARLHAQLDAAIPPVKTTSKALQERVASTKQGNVSANLSALFGENLRALDELENTTKALTANLLWVRSNWEQYARTVIAAEKMRQMRGPNGAE